MRILFVEPHESSLFSFRKELLDTLIANQHDVFLCINSTKRIELEYKNKTKEIIDLKFDLKNKNIFKNLKLLNKYKKIINRVKPDLIISYKIKPNIYCARYAKHIPMIANITGLGNLFKKNNIFSKIGVLMYRKSFKNVKCIFFQNKFSFEFFSKNNIPINSYKIIPGSGVNTSKFNITSFDKHVGVNFLFASRAIEEKGFYLLINAIPVVLQQNHNAKFYFLNAEDDILKNTAFSNLIRRYDKNVFVLPRSNEMFDIYKKCDFVVSPSFYNEGISNVLLESLSCGRPIITTNDNPGCMEVLQENINGFGVASNDLNSLIVALEKACNLSKKDIALMGINGRQYVVDNFERQIVIDCYLKKISEFVDDN